MYLRCTDSRRGRATHSRSPLNSYISKVGILFFLKVKIGYHFESPLWTCGRLLVDN